MSFSGTNKISALVIMKLFLILFPILPASAQTEALPFLELDKLQKIFSQAKNENKYILVYCISENCSDCTVESLLKDDSMILMSRTFLPVGVIIDSCSQREALYKVDSFHFPMMPTALVLSPGGLPVAVSYDKPNRSSLFDLLTKSMDPKRISYHSALKRYLNGDPNYSELADARNFIRYVLNEPALADRIVSEIIFFLAGQKESVLIQKKYLQLAVEQSQLITVKHPYFKLLLKQFSKVDKKVKQPGAAERVIKMCIFRDLIESIVSKAEKTEIEPNWKDLQIKGCSKYGCYFTQAALLDAKIRWYYLKKDWKKLEITYTAKTEKYGVDTTGMLKLFTNNAIWDIYFLHSKDRSAIRKAANWMRLVVDREPQSSVWTDTYANLLYKAGCTEEAIKWEQKVIALDSLEIRRGFTPSNHSYHLQVLEKMKSRTPTWPTEIISGKSNSQSR